MANCSRDVKKGEAANKLAVKAGRSNTYVCYKALNYFTLFELFTAIAVCSRFVTMTRFQGRPPKTANRQHGIHPAQRDPDIIHPVLAAAVAIRDERDTGTDGWQKYGIRVGHGALR